MVNETHIDFTPKRYDLRVEMDFSPVYIHTRRLCFNFEVCPTYGYWLVVT
jgi:hypothetical protein